MSDAQKRAELEAAQAAIRRLEMELAGPALVSREVHDAGEALRRAQAELQRRNAELLARREMEIAERDDRQREERGMVVGALDGGSWWGITGSRALSVLVVAVSAWAVMALDVRLNLRAHAHAAAGPLLAAPALVNGWRWWRAAALRRSRQQGRGGEGRR